MIFSPLNKELLLYFILEKYFFLAFSDIKKNKNNPYVADGFNVGEVRQISNYFTPPIFVRSIFRVFVPTDLPIGDFSFSLSNSGN